MRPSNKSRSRNKSGSNNQRRSTMGNIVNRVFESAGPDGKVRGTPQQIIDKYQVLARDAQVSGDRVQAESYLQHAEHYARLLVEAQRQNEESRQHQRDDRDDRDEREARSDDGQAGERQGGERQPGERQPGERQGGERQGGRPNGQHRDRRRDQNQGEPAGLATFGDEPHEDSGPVDTPEAAEWSPPPARQSQPQPAEPAPAEASAEQAPRGGDQPEAAPAAAEAANGGAGDAAEPAEAPAPKRPRARRKTKPAAEVIEAPAD